MIKPGLPYLDIIKSSKKILTRFLFIISGEYSMIKNAIINGDLDKESVIESLIAFKRSGASAIVTYFALDIAKKLSN